MGDLEGARQRSVVSEGTMFTFSVMYRHWASSRSKFLQVLHLSLVLEQRRYTLTATGYPYTRGLKISSASRRRLKWIHGYDRRPYGFHLSD